MPARNDAYFLLLDGETSGPHTLEELHQMWQEERITLDTLYVQPGMRGCKPVNLILNKVIGYQKPGSAQPNQPRSYLEAELDLEESRGMGPLYVLVAISLGLLIWLLASTFRPPPDPFKALNAGLETSFTHLTLINLNDYEWKDQTVILNGKPPEGYKYLIRALKAHESVTVSLPEFANDAGNRFAPWGMRVEEVWIGDAEEGYRYFNPPPVTGSPIPLPPPPSP